MKAGLGKRSRSGGGEEAAGKAARTSWREKGSQSHCQAGRAPNDAVAKVFQTDSLTRRLVLFHKIVLEKTIRTDEDIRKAAKEWISDPVAAERRYGHISDWDVSRVTNLSELFKGEESFNEDLSRWLTGNVTNMRGMFYHASTFNSDISRWDTGKVTDMTTMFYHAPAFRGDLSRWQVGNVRDMSGMFWDARSFNSDLSDWDTGKVEDMRWMFYHAKSFSGDLSNWDTRKVKKMNQMFTGAAALWRKPWWYPSHFDLRDDIRAPNET